MEPSLEAGAVRTCMSCNKRFVVPSRVVCNPLAACRELMLEAKTKWCPLPTAPMVACGVELQRADVAAAADVAVCSSKTFKKILKK